MELEPPTYKPKRFGQKVAYSFCKVFYKNNLKKCPAIKYAPKQTHHHTTNTFSYQFETETSAPSIASLALSLPIQELKAGESASLLLEVAMDDDSSHQVTSGIEWIINDSSLVSVDDNLILTAINEGQLTLQAKYSNILSNTITLPLYQEINGHYTSSST